MCYSSRRPTLSAKNRKLRPSFTQTQWNWTTNIWNNNGWLDMFQFLLQHWDGRVINNLNAWIHPAWWCGIYCIDTLWAPTEHHLNTTAYRVFVLTVFIFMTACFQQDNGPCHKDQIITNWFLEHEKEFSALKWPPQLPNFNPIDVGDWHQRCATNKFSSTVWCYHINMHKN